MGRTCPIGRLPVSEPTGFLGRPSTSASSPWCLGVNGGGGRLCSSASDVEDEDWADLEPLFFDEAAAVADHERRMRMRRELAHAEYQRRKAVLDQRRRAAKDRILEYDPKYDRTYYSRIDFVDLATFDLDEESPLGPMRETGTSIDVHGIFCKDVGKQSIPGDSVKTTSSDRVVRFVPCDSANLLSMKIVSSDVGFPMDVYGTVIARDSIDLKCVYLFRCDRDHSQLILTKDELLILTGPKRGLTLMDDIYIEIDLKIKGGSRQKDKQLSKGFITLDGMQLRFKNEKVVRRSTLDTKISKVVVTYAVVILVIEATFAIDVLQGRFHGEIVACTTSIRDSIVLHDSKLVEPVAGDGKGAIQLLRNIVAVSLKEKLIVAIAARTGDGKSKTKSNTIRFTPGVNGGDEKEVTCGSVKMCVKITWSIIDRS